MKEYFITAFLGGFIGYILANFVIGMSNNLPFKLGLKLGIWIKNLF